MPKQVA